MIAFNPKSRRYTRFPFSKFQSGTALTRRCSRQRSEIRPDCLFECPCLRGETHIRTSTPLTQSKCCQLSLTQPLITRISKPLKRPDVSSIRFTRVTDSSSEPSSIPTNLKNQPNQPAKKQGSEHVADFQPSWSINQRTPNLSKSP